MDYHVKRATGSIALDGDFYKDAQWKNANEIYLGECYRPEKDADKFKSDVRLKMLYDDTYIYGLFQVKDQFVRAVSKGHPEQVCYDSCVELFIRPMNNLRYYNFEFSANGNMLLYNVTNLRAGDFVPVDASEYVNIPRYHSLPAYVEPEIKDPVTWRLGFAIPIDFFVRYGDDVNPDLKGQIWTANVSKCADKTSNPHWQSWQHLPIVDFHLPEAFGKVIFD